MRPESRNAAYLWDMREAAREVMEFLQGTTYTRFASDKVLRYAVERQLHVIGEAARHISTSFKEAHPEIPWRAIIASGTSLPINTERFW